MTTRIQKWGNSQGIRFSKEILETVGFSVDDQVEIKINKNNEIIISKKKQEKLTFDALFKDWDGKKYDDGEFDWEDNGPVGNEIW